MRCLRFHIIISADPVSYHITSFLSDQTETNLSDIRVPAQPHNRRYGRQTGSEEARSKAPGEWGDEMNKRAMYYREALLREIREFLEKGIEVMIDGEDYDESESPSEISVVLESGSYMKYYTGDDSGRIIAVEFNKVRDTRK